VCKSLPSDHHDFHRRTAPSRKERTNQFFLDATDFSWHNPFNWWGTILYVGRCIAVFYPKAWSITAEAWLAHAIAFQEEIKQG
jgi:hypothetical protein